MEPLRQGRLGEEGPRAALEGPIPGFSPPKRQREGPTSIISYAVSSAGLKITGDRQRHPVCPEGS